MAASDSSEDSRIGRPPEDQATILSPPVADLPLYTLHVHPQIQRDTVNNLEIYRTEINQIPLTSLISSHLEPAGVLTLADETALISILPLIICRRFSYQP